MFENMKRNPCRWLIVLAGTFFALAAGFDDNHLSPAFAVMGITVMFVTFFTLVHREFMQ